MQICRVCGEEFSDNVFKDHLKVSHNLTPTNYKKMEVRVENTSIEEMEELVDGVLKIEEEVTESITVTPDETKERIFGKKPTIVDLTVRQLLLQESITEDELMSLVRNFKSGIPLTVTQERSAKLKKADADAESVKDKDSVKVEYVELADLLVKKYGFVCLSCKKVNNKKIWMMTKNK